MTAPDWNILLIGGGSGSGKTQLSRALAGYFGARVLEGDDLRWAIEAAVPKGADPDLHLFSQPDAWQQPMEELLDRTFRLSARICHAAEAVIARHQDMDMPLIIEAFWILPEFAAQSSFAGIAMGGVRSLFLCEDDPLRITRQRSGRGEDPGLYPSRLVQSMFWQHGLVIRQRAEALGLPVLESRPFDTLLDRAIATLCA